MTKNTMNSATEKHDFKHRDNMSVEQVNSNMMNLIQIDQ